MPKFSSKDRETINKRLLEEGEHLFNEKGLDLVTAEMISSASGIAKGTFYHFYKNKEHLYMVINNHLQETIFEVFKKQFQKSDIQSQVDQFYLSLCYIMDRFLEHPLILEIRPDIWKQIELKAPSECIQENNNRDLDLIRFLSHSGLTFRYDLETTMHLLQMQFTQLAYIKNETQNIELMKITFLALTNHLLTEAHE